MHKVNINIVLYSVHNLGEMIIGWNKTVNWVLIHVLLFMVLIDKYFNLY